MSKPTVVVGHTAHDEIFRATVKDAHGDALEFPEFEQVNRAFAPMVRDLEFDVCELAIATYLQAREAGKPITLIPVVSAGGFHHHQLLQLPDRDLLTPQQLVGRRVGVRAYSQTTGVWVRGVLSDEFDVHAKDITWVTTEEPHVAEYDEPHNVERSSLSLPELLKQGEIDAAILGRPAMKDGTELVSIVPDPHAAAQRWGQRNKTIPINHVLTVRTDFLREQPELVRSIYQLFTDAVDQSKIGDPGLNPRKQVSTYGPNPQLLAGLDVAVRYCLEQGLISHEVTAEELVSPFSEFLTS